MAEDILKKPVNIVIDKINKSGEFFNKLIEKPIILIGGIVIIYILLKK